MPTRKEVDELKVKWKNDPIWDLADTEGFEEYKQELSTFQMEQEQIWEEAAKLKEQRRKEEAEDMGLDGLYKIVLENRRLIKRQERAIELLADGENHEAYRALRGWEE